MNEKLTDAQVVEIWKQEVCTRAAEFEYPCWSDLWQGFVLGLGRPDLANYGRYLDLGFPAEPDRI
jgi:hypothetical protein